MEQQRIVTVVIEYSPSQSRVMVRGVFAEGQPLPAPLAPENRQNHVRCFLGADMGTNVGFAGLVAG
jgi:hypothetical protein